MLFLNNMISISRPNQLSILLIAFEKKQKKTRNHSLIVFGILCGRFHIRPLVSAHNNSIYVTMFVSRVFHAGAYKTKTILTQKQNKF